MIYCIWYPSGGFGHWINSILSLYGADFCCPNQALHFGSDGNSHDLPLVLPKYEQHLKESFVLPKIDNQLNYTILIDNGIDNESQEFRQFFKDCQIIKICYGEKDWPVVAKTYVIKAMRSTLDSQMATDDNWPTSDAWAKREKFFLALRDSPLQKKWRLDDNLFCLSIEDMMTYEKTTQMLRTFGVQTSNFKNTWHDWWHKNQQYFEPIQLAQRVIQAIQDKHNLDLSTVKDIWTQSVIYYFIWLEFQKEVPHNDFADFFCDTEQIREWLAV